MTKTELLEILRNGENSGVELMRGYEQPHDLAKEIAALLNVEGGYVLLGVEDDGTIRNGLTADPKKVEESVMEVCRVHIDPAIIPYWEVFTWAGSTTIGIITLPADSPDKPDKAKSRSEWVTYVRAGTTSRRATREEEMRLYQASGLLRYDIRPVPGSSLDDLDMRRLESYFRAVRRQDCPGPEDLDGWRRLLLNTDLMVENRGRATPTTGAMLLFGRTPNRFLPQAGISASAYQGTEKDYAAQERVELRGPLTPLLGSRRKVVENGLVEQAIEFVRRNTRRGAELVGGARRKDKWEYPEEAVREVVVNALAHRDYAIAVADIELAIYENRLEVVSPGRLPNTVTVEKMKLGYRATRNELMKDVLRDYRYIEDAGLGIPRKVIPGMFKHNGTEPDLLEEESRFTVRLWKSKPVPAAT